MASPEVSQSYKTLANLSGKYGAEHGRLVVSPREFTDDPKALFEKDLNKWIDAIEGGKLAGEQIIPIIPDETMLGDIEDSFLELVLTDPGYAQHIGGLATFGYAIEEGGVDYQQSHLQVTGREFPHLLLPVLQLPKGYNHERLVTASPLHELHGRVGTMRVGYDDRMTHFAVDQAIAPANL